MYVVFAKNFYISCNANLCLTVWSKDWKWPLDCAEILVKIGWLGGSVVEHQSLTGELSLVCTAPAADG